VLARLAAGDDAIQLPIQGASAGPISEPAHDGIARERFWSDALELPQYLRLKLFPQTVG
jgi:hypothetical protein